LAEEGSNEYLDGCSESRGKHAPERAWTELLESLGKRLLEQAS